MRVPGFGRGYPCTRRRGALRAVQLKVWEVLRAFWVVHRTSGSLGRTKGSFGRTKGGAQSVIFRNTQYYKHYQKRTILKTLPQIRTVLRLKCTSVCAEAEPNRVAPSAERGMALRSSLSFRVPKTVRDTSISVLRAL